MPYLYLMVIIQPVHLKNKKSILPDFFSNLIKPLL